MQFFFYLSVVSSVSGTTVYIRTPFAETLNFVIVFYIRNAVSDPRKIYKIIILYILVPDYSHCTNTKLHKFCKNL